jgi:hypothetical protein
MKLARLFCFLIILASSAVAAYAQTPVDPKVIVNFANDPGTCTPGPTLICYDGVGPLVETFGSPETFQYTGASPLTILFLEFTFVPPLTAFQCSTNIWTDCETLAGPYPPNVGIELEYLGAGANDGGGGTCGPCVGQLVSGDQASVTLTPTVSETPEPGSIILFATGLFSFFLASKRRAQART